MTEQGTRFTTEGLVIKTMNVGESDRLVTLLTKEYGILKAFASGANNVKSKKNSATALLTYSSFTVLKKKGTNRIYESAPIAQFLKMGEDIDVLTVSQYFCELGSVFANENTPSGELLRLLLNSLHFITEQKKPLPLIKAITELRVMTLCGYAPNLVACKKCAAFEKDIMYFNYSDGSLICKDCADENPTGTAIDKTLLSAMRHIVYSEFSKLYSFEIPLDSAVYLSHLTEKYLVNQTDYNFKTLEFLRSINTDGV